MALGLHQSGFKHVAMFESDKNACETLRLNFSRSEVVEHDLFLPYDFGKHGSVDLLAGGLPCPPFSKAGKQLGCGDERNLFERGLEIASEIMPRAMLFENVKGLLEARFENYRASISTRLSEMGYASDWKLIYAKDHGVPQLRPRSFLVAMRMPEWQWFHWPGPTAQGVSVGEALRDLMSCNGWLSVEDWVQQADKVAPTLVGGSKKHGGADLGPSRARQAWAKLGVNGSSLAAEAPCKGFSGMPKLTLDMAARLQSFPDDWKFAGKKTSTYRQIGNALPPPVAKVLGGSIISAFRTSDFMASIEAELLHVA